MFPPVVIVPPPWYVPLTSRFPFTSIRVEVKSISSSAAIAKSPSAVELM